MKTVIKDEISKEQVKLNLAINYMVIERVLRCMGIYNTICDVHEGLDGEGGIFASARNRSLLDKLLALGEAGLTVYLDEYHKLFGLSYSVLLGQEQIQLGIDIKDIDIPTEYKNLLYTKTYVVSEFKKAHDLSRLSLYQDIDRIELSEKEKALGQKIGTIDVKIDNDKLLNQLQFNPLGINTAGLFIMLFKHGCIKVYAGNKEIQCPFDMKKPDPESSEYYKKMYFDNVKKQNKYWNEVNKLFDNSFSNLKQSKWENKAALINVVINGRDNIYSLDSIIYSILRYLHMHDKTVEGTEFGNKKFHIMDIKDEALPYPLKFVDEISYPIVLDEDEHSELYEKSNLLTLMRALMICNEYMFADRKFIVIAASSIEREIKRYKERIKLLSAKQEQIDVELINKENFMLEEITYMHENLCHYNDIRDTIDEYVKYVNYLIEQQKLFEANPKEWVKKYISELDDEQRLLDQQIQELNCDIKLNKNENESMQSPTYGILCRKQETIKNRIAIIENHKKKVREKANQKNPVPFILLNEPYYEEIGLEHYSTRGTGEKTQKKKANRKQNKKQKEKTKE